MIEPRTWGLYARRSYQLAQRKGLRVFDQQAFEDACAVDGIRRLTDLAEKWCEWWVLTPERLAECLIDMRAPSYAQRRDG